MRTSANGQPAVAGYLRDDAGVWQTSFVGKEHFAAVGLPTSLS